MFLDRQFDLLSEKRKARQAAGSKGGNAKAMLKQKPSYKDKDKDKDNTNVDFLVFWDLYDKKKGDKNACEKKWNKLTDQQRAKIIETIPVFLGEIKDKQFQPLAATYLNQKRWEDEIKPTETNQKKAIFKAPPMDEFYKVKIDKP